MEKVCFGLNNSPYTQKHFAGMMHTWDVARHLGNCLVLAPETTSSGQHEAKSVGILFPLPGMWRDCVTRPELVSQLPFLTVLHLPEPISGWRRASLQTVALLLLLLISMTFVGETERLKYVYEFGHLCPVFWVILSTFPRSVPLNTELDPKCHAVELCFRDILHLSRIFLLFKYFGSVSVCLSLSLIVCEQQI